MATQDIHRAPTRLPVPSRTGAARTNRGGALERWRRDAAERKRREIVRRLRRTADRAHDTDPIRRRREALLHDRAAAVRTDLLEIAAILEYTRTPDSASVAILHKLLADGCDSPLYNREIQISELHSTLESVGARLGRHS